MYDRTKREFTGKRSLALSQVHRVICDQCHYATDVDFIEFRKGPDGFIPVAVLEYKGVRSNGMSEFQGYAIPKVAEMLGVPLYVVRPEKEVDDVADLVLLVQREDEDAVQRMNVSEFNELLHNLRGTKHLPEHVEGWQNYVERKRGSHENDLKGTW